MSTGFSHAVKSIAPGSVSPAQPAEDAAAQEFLALLRRDGFVTNTDAKLTALTDGVSSEIYRVDDGATSFVVKRALPKLKVKDHWTANVNRNRYERMFIEYVAGFLQEAVPSLRSGANDSGYFAMELLGPDFMSWKNLLMRSEARIEHAQRAATILAAIHSRSAGGERVAAQFDTTENFTQLRIDPYLSTTGSRHADMKNLFDAEATRLAATRLCLVHGDFSPKNMMISPSRFVLLDCEVAWYGDPAFDIAFLLTHLLLKALYHAPRQIGLDGMAGAFWQRYVEQVGRAIDASALESRVSRLLPMLLLARVDGKSPVEYLAPSKQELVRKFARGELLVPVENLSDRFDRWFASLTTLEAGG